MKPKLTREELIALVERIENAEGSENEIDRMIEVLEENVPDPNVSDLIFYPEEKMTAAQVVDKALAYTPITL
ncbi:bacteriocin immunity protein [Cerasicoccus maritimus]|uniref:bacteriocin immunity protein n=1 Tax=Cerasicoccus maritimus TaxID=490089 RepID=UPI0028527C2D|nr:bacteriocin immunity protein [Cerasicoccus maritimus]